MTVDIADRIGRAEADCGTAVTNRPVCANPAWTLFGLTSNRYFCCPSGYFGVKSVELSGRGLCEPNLDGLPTTRIASTITRGTPATTGTAAGSGGSGGSGQTTSPGGSPGSTGTSSNSAGGSGGGGSVSAGVIAGSVVGGVALLLLGIALVLWLHRKSLRRNPGPGPGPGPGPTPETKLDPSPPPPQSSPSPGMITQHQYQHPSTPQFGSPAVATPPPQYAYPQPPEADGVGRFEMPVHAQELPSHIGPRSR